MPPRCLPDAPQMPLKCLSDASQMSLRCLPDVSQMPPRCFLKQLCFLKVCKNLYDHMPYTCACTCTYNCTYALTYTLLMRCIPTYVEPLEVGNFDSLFLTIWGLKVQHFETINLSEFGNVEFWSSEVLGIRTFESLKFWCSENLQLGNFTTLNLLDVSKVDEFEGLESLEFSKPWVSQSLNLDTSKDKLWLWKLELLIVWISSYLALSKSGAFLAQQISFG